jgi:hypothetical protein
MFLQLVIHSNAVCFLPGLAVVQFLCFDYIKKSLQLHNANVIIIVYFSKHLLAILAILASPIHSTTTTLAGN